jgi:hypothetical protein
MQNVYAVEVPTVTYDVDIEVLEGPLFFVSGINVCQRAVN